MARLSFRCSDELVGRVDVARGDVARERWLRRAVERALGGDAGSIPAAPVDTVPAPAEQLEEVDRILTNVAREFRPYPKGGKR